MWRIVSHFKLMKLTVDSPYNPQQSDCCCLQSPQRAFSSCHCCWPKEKLGDRRWRLSLCKIYVKAEFRTFKFYLVQAFIISCVRKCFFKPHKQSFLNPNSQPFVCLNRGFQIQHLKQDPLDL